MSFETQKLKYILNSICLISALKIKTKTKNNDNGFYEENKKTLKVSHFSLIQINISKT